MNESPFATLAKWIKETLPKLVKTEVAEYVSKNIRQPEDGRDGVDGKDGKDGRDGADGKNGVDGINGQDGKDGINGVNGIDGKDGRDGVDGTNGFNGRDGQDGQDGLSAYEIAVQEGFDGNEEQWLQSLIPAHRWQGTSLQFQNPDGTWGKLVNLKGNPGGGGGGIPRQKKPKESSVTVVESYTFSNFTVEDEIESHEFNDFTVVE